jgi:hypothetical protein
MSRRSDAQIVGQPVGALGEAVVEPLGGRVVRCGRPADLGAAVLAGDVREPVDQRTADTANESGVSTQYLPESERGLKEPSSEILGAVRGALGLRLVDLTARLTRSLSSRPSGPLARAI